MPQSFRRIQSHPVERSASSFTPSDYIPRPDRESPARAPPRRPKVPKRSEIPHAAAALPRGIASFWVVGVQCVVVEREVLARALSLSGADGVPEYGLEEGVVRRYGEGKREFAQGQRSTKHEGGARVRRGGVVRGVRDAERKHGGGGWRGQWEAGRRRGAASHAREAPMSGDEHAVGVADTQGAGGGAGGVEGAEMENVSAHARRRDTAASALCGTSKALSGTRILGSAKTCRGVEAEDWWRQWEADRRRDAARKQCGSNACQPTLGRHSGPREQSARPALCHRRRYVDPALQDEQGAEQHENFVVARGAQWGKRRVVGTVGGGQEDKRSEPQMGGADDRVGGIARRSSENERFRIYGYLLRFRHVIVVRDVSIHRIERKRAQLDETCALREENLAGVQDAEAETVRGIAGGGTLGGY
ncbi:hypothetical protein B0H14DRAFT_3165889 [Mycena olivaceomarginata]|nr:hypothetical protein B0H14DRAFT_3165889 [Mycena olivaceomarginata]